LHTVFTALAPGNLKMGNYLLPADNPLGVDWLGPVLGVVWLIAPFLFPLPSIVAVVLRFRGSRGVERQHAVTIDRPSCGTLKTSSRRPFQPEPWLA
jgi:hypothetical protein